MKPGPHREPLALHGLIPQHELPPLSVEAHLAFRESIAAPARKWDEVDELVEEIRKAEFEEKGARP